MPRGTWSPKRERQYTHIVASCLARGKRSVKVCKRIAAATVNATRRRKGELKGLAGRLSARDRTARGELCYLATEAKHAPTSAGRGIARVALLDAREAAKARGWTAKRIQRAETCR